MKTLIQPKRYVPKVGDAIIYSRKRLMVIWDQATRFSVIEKSTMLVLEELIFDLVEDEDGCVRLANPDQLWGGNGYHDNVFMDDAYTEHMNQIVATVENKEYQLTEIKDSQESGMPPKPSFWKDLFGRRSKKQKRLVSTLFQNQQPEGSFIVYVNEYSFTKQCVYYNLFTMTSLMTLRMILSLNCLHSCSPNPPKTVWVSRIYSIF